MGLSPLKGKQGQMHRRRSTTTNAAFTLFIPTTLGASLLLSPFSMAAKGTTMTKPWVTKAEKPVPTKYKRIPRPLKMKIKGLLAKYSYKKLE